MAVDLPDRVAGVAYSPGTTARRLTQIGAVAAENDDIVMVTPPSWRPDLLQPADLVEEVLRLEGLEVIPSVLPSAPAGRGLSAGQRRRRAVGKSLALSGYVEVLPTPFLPAGVFDAWGLPADDERRHTTQVLNPLEADRPHLATTLLPGLLEALTRNVSRGIVDVALFAIALQWLGLVAAIAVLVLVGANAARDVRQLDNLTLAAVMIVFSVAVFVWLLGLPLPLWPIS